MEFFFNEWERNKAWYKEFSFHIEEYSSTLKYKNRRFLAMSNKW